MARSPFDIGSEIEAQQGFGAFQPIKETLDIKPQQREISKGGKDLGFARSDQPGRVSGEDFQTITLASRNREAFQHTLGGFGGEEGEAAFNFNIPVNIEREGDTEAVRNTFADQIKFREGIAQEGQSRFGQSFVSEFANSIEADQRQEVMSGISKSSIGRIQLLKRLRGKFGPNFLRVPAAQRLISEFDAFTKQGHDVSGLQKLVSQGKTALSFLGTDMFEMPFGEGGAETQAKLEEKFGKGFKTKSVGATVA